MKDSIMNVVCYKIICYESELLRTVLLWTWSVMNVICYERGLLWTRSVMNRSVMNVVCYVRGLLWTGCFEKEPVFVWLFEAKMRSKLDVVRYFWP